MQILREPLVHFLAVGAVIFAASKYLSRGGPTPTSSAGDKSIIVTADKAALLRNGFVLDNQRDPTAAELQRLIDTYVREEVLVREARAQGLDRDDSIIRRRLVQKMEFAVAEPAAPIQADLAAYLAQHPEAFRTADGKVPPLADIHGAVQAAWMNQRRHAAIQEMYGQFRAQYQVIVETPATQPETRPAAQPAAGGGAP